MQFEQFASLRHVPGLRHAITTRHGGVSSAPFSSLNLGLHVGDEALQVLLNRRLAAQALGFDEGASVWAQQVHGTDARIVTPENRGRGAFDYSDALPQTDALVCDSSNTPAWILVADCAPLLLVDSGRQVLGVVHAGWRGALGQISWHTISRMSAEFGTEAEEVLAGIGPCLCVNCLEVGEEVALEAERVGAEACIVRQGFDKPHLDLRRALLDDLTASGVRRERIEVLDECPKCLSEKYFSHRGEGGKAGRFGLVAWWE